MWPKEMSFQSMKWNNSIASNRSSGFLVSGTHSGVGKTTVSLALMAALSKFGLTVQPFKIGPDFIDPSYHRLATGRDSINLDHWMMGSKNIQQTFIGYSAPADISIIEGMGALFDGENGTRNKGSNAYLARQLEIPIILVIDIWGMTRTVAALMKGFLEFDKKTQIAGFVFNRAGSKKHYEMVMNSLPSSLRQRVYGYLLHSDNLMIPERHLGLVTPEENIRWAETIQNVTKTAKQTLDFQKLIDHFLIKKQKRKSYLKKAISPKKRIRLGVVRDKAFCFYYPENLNLLEQAGAELVFFSLVEDSSLPKEIDGLYIGGGYPESFASLLSKGKRMKEEILKQINFGMPVYAECGGFIYLGKSLKDCSGKTYPMVSALPIEFEMDKNFLAIQYVEIETCQDTLLGPKGTKARGQQFHQSRITTSKVKKFCYQSKNSLGEKSKEGFFNKNLVASYTHIHFKSNPSIPSHFVSACLKFRKEKSEFSSF